MVAIRLMGRRQIGELQPSEFAVTMVVSNLATLTIEDTRMPISYGLVPMLSIVAIDVLVSWVGLKSPKFRKLLSGKPKVIISNGVVDQSQLRKIRYTIDDLMEALRGEGVFNVEDVQYAIAETTGKVTVYPKYYARGVTNQDLNLSSKDVDPPRVIISDGVLLTNALEDLKLSKQWVLGVLNSKHLTVKDVFLMTCDPERKYQLIVNSQ
jgi:uncharacterized membrane protein YcaP (DUF421 family)